MAMTKSRVCRLPADLQTLPPVAAALHRPQDSGGDPPPPQWLRRRTEWPDRCRDVAKLLERHCGGGRSHAVKERRLLSCIGVSSGSSFNSSATSTAWVVAEWSGGGGANVMVNSDASSLLCRPAEATHLYITHHPATCSL